MLRIPSSEEIAWALSELSLVSTTSGSRSFAACSYAGAIILHGPHQGAQTSTSTGKVVRAKWRLSVASSTSTGWAAKILRPHFPHFADRAGRFAMSRLTLAQELQTIISSPIAGPS